MSGWPRPWRAEIDAPARGRPATVMSIARYPGVVVCGSSRETDHSHQ